MLTNCRRRFGVLAICLIWFSTPAAFAQTLFDFNLPPQALADSLRAIGHQTSVNILFDPRSVEKLTAPAVHGQFSASQAVNRVLAGTNLAAEQTEANTLLVEPKDKAGKAQGGATLNDPGNSNQQGGSGKQSSQDFRVAQTGRRKEASAASSTSTDEQGKKKESDALQEVVVTGTRIPTAAGKQSQPVRTYTHEDIENSGQVTLVDFLNTLPDVSTAVNDSGYNNNGLPGQASVTLHGLPIGTTLVLLNGRRVEANYAGFVDIDNIPAAFIDKIDVLPVGASAIYGADALGGAINIVLKNRLSGLEIDTTYGHADAQSDKTANLGWGKVWDRGSVSLIASYQDRGLLLGRDRQTTFGTDLPADAPTYLYIGQDCAPGNVFTLDGSNLPGLNSPQAAIPAGIQGKPNIAQFVPTAGKTNTCSFLSDVALIPHSTREGGVLSGHFAATPSVDIFTEVVGSHEHVKAPDGDVVDTALIYTGATLARTNPYNPFGETVGINFSLPLPAGYESDGYFVRPLIGLRGTMTHDWEYEAVGFVSFDRFAPNSQYGNASALQDALNSSSPSSAINPFSTRTPSNPAVLSAVATPLNNLFFDDSSKSDLQAFMRGPVASLPAGPLNLVVGTEGSQEKLKHFDGTETTYLRRTSYAIYSEARAPLLTRRGGRNSGDGEEILALSVAGRYDHSDDYGGKLTWQAGIVWKPIDTLAITGGHGISYEAPTLAQLSGFTGSVFGDLGVFDPFRGNQAVTGTEYYGANSKLRPETGRSNDVSISYTSDDAHKLHASLTYFSIDISNFIGQPPAQVVVDNPAVYPGAVMRAPPSASDIALGWPGPITSINNTYFNFGDVDIAGLDADLRYQIDTAAGTLSPSLALANIFKWESALAPGTPLASYVSQAGGIPGWAPRWKGTLALSWTGGPVTASLAERYTGTYKDTQVYVPNSNELGNFWILDANVRYDVGKSVSHGNRWLSGTYVTVGAINLLNKLPPFSYGFPPYDLTQYDIRGRYLYIRVGAKW